MASEWEDVCLNDVALATDYVANGSFASLKDNVTYRSQPDYAVLVRTTDFNNSWNGNYVWVDQTSYEFLSKSNLEIGDLVLSNVGSVGVVFRVPDLGRPMTLGPNAVVCRTRNPTKLDQRFLFYYFSSADGQQSLRSITSGSVQPKFNKTDFRGLSLTLPPLAAQKAIAAVLGALDDKIELNRRMNATLEAMARALFQSWFVDFDPVRAKLDGRKPIGLDETTAALFPGTFQDSPLGPIPRGWDAKPLGEVADLNWGDTNTTKASYVYDGFTAFSASGADGYLPHFDFEKTGVVVSAIGANAGVTWLAHGKWSCIKNTLRFWASASGVSTEFLFFATHGREKWPQRGSAQPFISQGDARAMKVLVPAGGLAESFGAVVRPWLAKIEHNLHQSRTLATLRDTLLPKLLSGELSVAPTDKESLSVQNTSKKS